MKDRKNLNPEKASLDSPVFPIFQSTKNSMLNAGRESDWTFSPAGKRTSTDHFSLFHLNCKIPLDAGRSSEHHASKCTVKHLPSSFLFHLSYRSPEITTDGRKALRIARRTELGSLDLVFHCLFVSVSSFPLNLRVCLAYLSKRRVFVERRDPSVRVEHILLVNCCRRVDG